MTLVIASIDESRNFDLMVSLANSLHEISSFGRPKIAIGFPVPIGISMASGGRSMLTDSRAESLVLIVICFCGFNVDSGFVLSWGKSKVACFELHHASPAVPHNLGKPILLAYPVGILVSYLLELVQKSHHWVSGIDLQLCGIFRERQSQRGS